MIRTLTLVLLLCVAGHGSAQVLPPPAGLDQRAGFDQRIGATLPMNLPMQDQHGEATTLADLAHGKPLLLAMGYYGCPNLCDAVLHGLGNTVAAMSLHMGDDYEVVFVDIDSRETAADAARAVRTFIRMKPEAKVDRWHLLFASPSTVHALADAVGYRYFLDPRNRQIDHPAGIVVVTAEGKVAQYFLGVAFPPDAVRAALAGATKGRLGARIEQFVMLCCGYDPTTGRYSLLINRLLQLAGLGFVAMVIVGCLRLQSRSRA